MLKAHLEKKTNSDMDGQNCTVCHSGTMNSWLGTATITSDIPTNGYVIVNTYTITLTGLNQTAQDLGLS